MIKGRLSRIRGEAGVAQGPSVPDIQCIFYTQTFLGTLPRVREEGQTLVGKEDVVGWRWHEDREGLGCL